MSLGYLCVPSMSVHPWDVCVSLGCLCVLRVPVHAQEGPRTFLSPAQIQLFGT